MEDLEVERPANSPTAPPVATDFEVEQKHIGPLYNVWSFLVGFGKNISLSAFSCEDFAEALMADDDSTNKILNESHMALLRLIVKHKEETKIKKTSITASGWKHVLQQLLHVRLA